MGIGSGNRSTRRKLVSVPFGSPQVPHDLILPRTWAVAVGRRRRTAWAMALPKIKLSRNGKHQEFWLNSDIFYLYKISYPCNRPWRPIGLWDAEAPTFSLDSRLTDGGKVVSLMRRPHFTSKKIRGTHFC
jgi:hypothetical protein